MAVHGCGGVGLSAVMIATALGANVLAVDVSDAALDLARTLGAVAPSMRALQMMFLPRLPRSPKAARSRRLMPWAILWRASDPCAGGAAAR